MADGDGRRFGTAALVIVGVLGFVLGAIVGWGALGDVGETPCWEVRGRISPVLDDLDRTGGSGDTGQAAARSVAQTAEEHPDCFSPEERAYFEDLRDSGAGDTTDGETTDGDTSDGGTGSGDGDSPLDTLTPTATPAG